MIKFPGGKVGGGGGANLLFYLYPSVPNLDMYALK